VTYGRRGAKKKTIGSGSAETRSLRILFAEVSTEASVNAEEKESERNNNTGGRKDLTNRKFISIEGGLVEKGAEHIGDSPDGRTPDHTLLGKKTSYTKNRALLGKVAAEAMCYLYRAATLFGRKKARFGGVR